MTTKLYVVIGSNGEYSEQNQWLVRAFTEEHGAKLLIIQLDGEAVVQSWMCATCKKWWASCKCAHCPPAPSTDKHAKNLGKQLDGLRYHYETVSLEEK